MPRPLIAGNWKMNLVQASAVALAEKLAKEAEKSAGVDLAVFPPSVYVAAVGKVLAGSKIAGASRTSITNPTEHLPAKSASR